MLTFLAVAIAILLIMGITLWGWTRKEKEKATETTEIPYPTAFSKVSSMKPYLIEHDLLRKRRKLERQRRKANR